MKTVITQVAIAAVKPKAGLLVSALKVANEDLKALGKAKVINKSLTVQTPFTIKVSKAGDSIIYKQGSTEKKPLQRLAANADTAAILGALKEIGYKQTKEKSATGTTLIKTLTKAPNVSYIRFSLITFRGKAMLDCNVVFNTKVASIVSDEKMTKDVEKLVKKFLG